MRIISGNFKGRNIHTPKNLPVRPTTDFAKESLFNILNNLIDFENIKVLDLFAGTGNISYEFLSRGSGDITCVDLNFNCTNFIKKTFDELQFRNGKVFKMNVFSFLKNETSKYNLIFADPPYDIEEMESIPSLIFEKNLLRENGILVIEHGEKTNFSNYPHFSQHRKYGNVNFSFFEQSTNPN